MTHTVKWQYLAAITYFLKSEQIKLLLNAFITSYNSHVQLFGCFTTENQVTIEIASITVIYRNYLPKYLKLKKIWLLKS